MRLLTFLFLSVGLFFVEIPKIGSQFWLVVVVNGIYDSNQELRFHSEQIPPAGVAYTCGEYVTGHRVNSKELVSYVPVQWYQR